MCALVPDIIKILGKLSVFKVVGVLLFLLEFLGWVNGEIVQFTHPTWLLLPLSFSVRWSMTEELV